MLLGLVAKNAILLVDFAIHEKAKGHARAVRVGGRSRPPKASIRFWIRSFFYFIAANHGAFYVIYPITWQTKNF